jgi:hypothetical protein
MYTRPAVPRSIGGVLDDAIRLYRASFPRVWPLSLICALLWAAVAVYATWSMGPLEVQSLSIRGASAATSAAAMAATFARFQRLEHSPALWGAYLLMMLIWLVFRAAIIRRQDAVAEDRQDSLGEALGYGVRHLPEIVVAAIVFCIVISVGFIVFIVPGLWLWGSLQLWLVALCAEDLGPFAALSRSWKLIERHWWRTSSALFVAFVIVWVIGLAEGLMVGLLSAAMRTETALVLAFSQLLGALLSVFTTPLITVVMLAIFYDLRLRREGGDLAARVNTLQTV